MMCSLRFLAALVVGLIWAGAAWATCGDGVSTCFWIGGTGTMNFSSDSAHWSTSSGGTTCSCEPIAGDSITFDGSSGGGTVTPAANTPALNAITADNFAGTLAWNTNNNNVTAKSFSDNSSATRTLNCGTGAWTINGVTGVVWQTTTSSGFTFTCTGNTITFNATATGNRSIDVFSNQHFGTISLVGSGGYFFDFANNASFTIDTLNVTPPVIFRSPNAQTLTLTNAPAWAASGASGILVMSHADGVQASISISASSTNTGVTVRDIHCVGTGVFTFNSSYNVGDDTGCTINAPSAGGGGGGFIGGGL